MLLELKYYNTTTTNQVTKRTAKLKEQWEHVGGRNESHLEQVWAQHKLYELSIFDIFNMFSHHGW